MIAILEKEIKINKLDVNKNKYFKTKWRLNFLAVKTKKYKSRKKPAKEFGWENVPYGRKNSTPCIVAFATPGVERVNSLSPK